MERNEQTGHICRWMALGIMAAIIIVGCTIVIGLFEWRDRNEIEYRNAELHECRKEVHDLNMHIAELSLLGETVADWDSSDVSHYHKLRLEMDSMLQSIEDRNSSINVEGIRLLFVAKERLLLQIRNAIQKRNDIHVSLVAEVPKIVEKSKKEKQILYSTPRSTSQKKKRGFWTRLFGKKEKPVVETVSRKQQNVTTKMLATLNQEIIAKYHAQSQKVIGHLDSLGIRNEAINSHLQKMIAAVDEHVNNGIVEREQQIDTLEGHYIYYYIGMLSSLLLVLLCMFLLVRRNKKRTDRLIGELNEQNKENVELIKLRRQTIQAITHELRIRLATIKNNLCMIESDSISDTAVSKESIAGMEQMLNDLLDYFRLDNGKETILAKPFTIKGVGTRLSSEFAALADKKGIALTVENSSDEIVLGDKEKILSIGRNLLSNALKFTDAGSIALRINYVDGTMLLSVHDTGTGMDEEEQRQIFDAFKQLGNAATKDGFGLGLSIVKNLVGMMNGKIELTSKKNVGSTFTVEISLPLVHENDIEKENNIFGDNSAEVIVIDDNELILQRMQGMFAEYGIKCDTCMGMDELLARMREKEYDILFTDLKMQGANGYDVLKILRMSNVGNSKTIPVVAVTGSAGVKEEDLINKGFSGCIFKPFSIKELMDKTNQFIKREIHKNGKIDLSPLFEYGEKPRTLWLFEEETVENIRRIDKAWEKGDRHELKEILHSMRGTWELIGCGTLLNRVFSNVKNPTSSDKKISQDIYEIKRQCNEIIKAIQECQKGGDA